MEKLIYTFVKRTLSLTPPPEPLNNAKSDRYNGANSKESMKSCNISNKGN